MLHVGHIQLRYASRWPPKIIPGRRAPVSLITGIEEAEATGRNRFPGRYQDGRRQTLYNWRPGAGVTAGGDTLSIGNRRNAYAAVAKIHFDGMHYRTDIGQKGLKRW